MCSRNTRFWFCCVQERHPLNITVLIKCFELINVLLLSNWNQTHYTKKKPRFVRGDKCFVFFSKKCEMMPLTGSRNDAQCGYCC